MFGRASFAVASAIMAMSAVFQGYRMKAPNFNAGTADGKQLSLSSLTADKPVVLYFIKSQCPVNAHAEKYFNRIYDATDCGNLVGVFNGNKDEFQTWQQRFNAPFPVILDPDLKIIHSFGAASSPWVVRVDQKGRIANEWRGYSASIVDEIANLLKPGAKVDHTGAPLQTTYG